MSPSTTGEHPQVDKAGLDTQQSTGNCAHHKFQKGPHSQPRPGSGSGSGAGHGWFMSTGSVNERQKERSDVWKLTVLKLTEGLQMP